jgi:hypothetical protein
MNRLGRSAWKIQRQLGLELPGIGKPGALEHVPFEFNPALVAELYANRGVA